MLIDRTRTAFKQFFYTLLSIPTAIQFVREHQPWKGFWKYGWVSRFSILVAVLLGLQFLQIVLSYATKPSEDPIALASNMASMVGEFVQTGYSFLFVGGMKYGMLFLLEVLIFHFTRSTIQILTKQEEDNTQFNTFVKAQIRMLKVVFWAWLMEGFTKFIIQFAGGIISPIAYIQPILFFGVHCYYLGIPILDNYHEQFQMKIRDSFRFTRKYIGVAVACGLIVNLAFIIPVIGPILLSLLVAVTASITMYELSDLHLLGGDLEARLENIESDIL